MVLRLMIAQEVSGSTDQHALTDGKGRTCQNATYLDMYWLSCLPHHAKAAMKDSTLLRERPDR